MKKSYVETVFPNDMKSIREKKQGSLKFRDFLRKKDIFEESTLEEFVEKINTNTDCDNSHNFNHDLKFSYVLGVILSHDRNCSLPKESKKFLNLYYKIKENFSYLDKDNFDKNFFLKFPNLTSIKHLLDDRLFENKDIMFNIFYKKNSIYKLNQSRLLDFLLDIPNLSSYITQFFNNPEYDNIYDNIYDNEEFNMSIERGSYGFCFENAFDDQKLEYKTLNSFIYPEGLEKWLFNGIEPEDPLDKEFFIIMLRIIYQRLHHCLISEFHNKKGALLDKLLIESETKDRKNSKKKVIIPLMQTNISYLIFDQQRAI